MPRRNFNVDNKTPDEIFNENQKVQYKKNKVNKIKAYMNLILVVLIIIVFIIIFFGCQL